MVGYDDVIELDYGEFMELNQYIRTALRPVSREQVEKVWRGEWMAFDECSNEGVYCKRCKDGLFRNTVKMEGESEHHQKRYR